MRHVRKEMRGKTLPARSVTLRWSMVLWSTTSTEKRPRACERRESKHANQKAPGFLLLDLSLKIQREYSSSLN